MKTKYLDGTGNLVYKMGDIPFMVGPTLTPSNAEYLPDLLPFSYYSDRECNYIRQAYSEEVDQYLQVAYEKGSILAIPMDTAGEGSLYLFDFLKFIEGSVSNINEKVILEIGCGRGALVQVLQEKCAKVMGVEPGSSQKKYWEEKNINVVNDFFPSDKVKDQFDVIIAFCVLEHIYDSDKFIQSILNQLEDGGQVILAVPNCEDQIENCDPSMFVHEHYSYFSRKSLARFMSKFDLEINNITFGGYGGVIYVCAQKSLKFKNIEKKYEDKFEIEQFSQKLTHFIDFISKRVEIYNSEGKTLGIYCPSRAVTTIPIVGNYRFFDDDPQIYGHFHPPFKCRIENREDLLSNPVDILWIFSYSFGETIRNKLLGKPQLANTKILTLNELKETEAIDVFFP